MNKQSTRQSTANCEVQCKWIRINKGLKEEERVKIEHKAKYSCKTQTLICTDSEAKRNIDGSRLKNESGVCLVLRIQLLQLFSSMTPLPLHWLLLPEVVSCWWPYVSVNAQGRNTFHRKKIRVLMYGSLYMSAPTILLLKKNNFCEKKNKPPLLAFFETHACTLISLCTCAIGSKWTIEQCQNTAALIRDRVG